MLLIELATQMNITCYCYFKLLDVTTAVKTGCGQCYCDIVNEKTQSPTIYIKEL